MFRRMFRTLAVSSVCLSTVLAQSTSRPFPASALAAKTVAIVNETGNHDVEKGAVAALASWGQFRVVDDPEQADITLRFVKTKTHEGTSTQKSDEAGKQTDSGYSMTFGSSIHRVAKVCGDGVLHNQDRRLEVQGGAFLCERFPYGVSQRNAAGKYHIGNAVVVTTRHVQPASADVE